MKTKRFDSSEGQKTETSESNCIKPDVSKCAKCNDEYQRGIEDGKIIAEHGTVNWID